MFNQSQKQQSALLNQNTEDLKQSMLKQKDKSALSK